jgi:hypothetical protein
MKMAQIQLSCCPVNIVRACNNYRQIRRVGKRKKKVLIYRNDYVFKGSANTERNMIFPFKTHPGDKKKK